MYEPQCGSDGFSHVAFIPGHGYDAGIVEDEVIIECCQTGEDDLYPGPVVPDPLIWVIAVDELLHERAEPWQDEDER